MSQHDQMREALLLARTCLKSFYPDTFDKKAIQDYSKAMVAIEQSLAAERTTLVRLTDKEIDKIQANINAKYYQGVLKDRDFANAIMDAFLQKNGDNK